MVLFTENEFSIQLIIIPFLETLTPINVVKAWEATKHLFLKKLPVIYKHPLFRPTKMSTPPPLDLLILNLERSGVATRVPVVLKKVLRGLQAQGKALLTLIAL